MSISLCAGLWITVGCVKSTRISPELSLMNDSTRMLERLSQPGVPVIPDAILNNSQCAILFPTSGSSPSVPRRGLAACRSDSGTWSIPLTVLLRAENAKETDCSLLLLTLSSSSANSLVKGEMPFTAENRENSSSLDLAVSELELRADVVLYSECGPSLARSALRGVVVTESGTWRPVFKLRSDSEQKGLETLFVALSSYFSVINPTGVVIHHTGIDMGETALQSIDRYHQSRGFEVTCFGRVYHVAYHYLIMPDGTIEAGRPERCEGAHAKGYNSYLGISMVGDFSERGESQPTVNVPTKRQVDSLVSLTKQLMLKYRIPLHHVVRHRDIASTTCPGDGFLFKSFLARLNESNEATAGRD